MNASYVLLLCVVGGAVGYYAPRETPYNIGPNDPFTVENAHFLQEPSQRLFWNKFGNNGSNQVGGTGWWATLTNKFPFLGNMFGRMELQNQYSVPKQYYQPQDFNTPTGYQPQNFNSPTGYRPQFYQSPSYQQQNPFYQHPQFQQRFFPSARDVAITDDAVIVTPPHIPINPIVPQPAPSPVPEPAPGYQYNKPLNRLELPHK